MTKDLNLEKYQLKTMPVSGFDPCLWCIDVLLKSIEASMVS
jgi:hypothetical protein